MGEHRPYKARVTGSSPVASTTSPLIISKLKKHTALVQQLRCEPQQTSTTSPLIISKLKNTRHWFNNFVASHSRHSRFSFKASTAIDSGSRSDKPVTLKRDCIKTRYLCLVLEPWLRLPACECRHFHWTHHRERIVTQRLALPYWSMLAHSGERIGQG